MGRDQRAVDIHHVEGGVQPRGPRGAAGRHPGLGDPIQPRGSQGPQRAPHGGRRGHGPKQVRLVAQDREVTQGGRPVGDGDRQLRQHRAAVMTAPTLLQRRQGFGQLRGQPHVIGDRPQHMGADMRHDAVVAGLDSAAGKQCGTMHLRSALLRGVLGVFPTPLSRTRRAFCLSDRRFPRYATARDGLTDDDSEYADALRKMSPFVGLITQAERDAISRAYSADASESRQPVTRACLRRTEPIDSAFDLPDDGGSVDLRRTDGR